MQSQLFHFSSRQRHSANIRRNGGAEHTCTQRKGRVSGKSRTAVRRINRPCLEHLSGGGSWGGSASPESPFQRKQLPSSQTHKTDLWFSSTTGQEAKSIFMWSLNLPVIVRSRHTWNTRPRCLGRRDLTGLLALERLLAVRTGSSASCLLVKKWSFLWVAGFQGSKLHPTLRRQQWAEWGPQLGVATCIKLSESGGKDQWTQTLDVWTKGE